MTYCPTINRNRCGLKITRWVRTQWYFSKKALKDGMQIRVHLKTEALAKLRTNRNLLEGFFVSKNKQSFILKCLHGEEDDLPVKFCYCERIELPDEDWR